MFVATKLRRRTVHPRACGERNLMSAGRSLPSGSSPRLRGTPLATVQKPGAFRFIPAPAGNAP